jgi:hypothetical protein
MTLSIDSVARHHLHWETVLDRLELDLILAERKLADPDAPDPEPWSEPHVPGPIPPDLVERAQGLLDRQATVRDRLTVASFALRRHQDFAARVDRATTTPDRPVYLDIDA